MAQSPTSADKSAINRQRGARTRSKSCSSATESIQTYREGAASKKSSVHGSTTFSRRQTARSKNTKLQNSNNNFQQQPSNEHSSRRDGYGGILRSFHGSGRRPLDDVIRNRPASLLTKDHLFTQHPSISCQSKPSVFSSPRRPNLGIKKKVLDELDPKELFRGQGDEDEAAASANQQRDDAGGGGNEAGENPSSWSVMLMVLAASARLICDMWERNFDILTFDDDSDVPSVAGSTEL